MGTKIVLALTLVALLVGFCQGYEDIYGHQFEKVFKTEKLNHRFTDVYAPDAREVSRLLVRAFNKGDALEASKGVTISKLLDLSSSYFYCRHEKFAEFEEWRQLFSGPDGNVYLLNYVTENINRLFNECADDIDKVFKIASSTSSPEGVYSQQITKYVETTGEENDSQQVTVEKFLDAKILSENKKEQFIKGCAALEPRVKENLSFFMKDDKKVSDYLDNLGDSREALLYKRCKVINQIFGKQ